jgi:hypothetical protein
VLSFGGSCYHRWVVCVIIIGWFVLSVLDGLCCHLVVRVVIVGWFALSSLGDLRCHVLVFWI